MNNDKYYVTDHQYNNTGGHIMVSVFTVFCRKENVTRFVVCNEDGMTWQTADTVHCAELFDHKELNNIILRDIDWDVLTAAPHSTAWFDNDDYELFKYCQFEFYKKDCAYFSTRREVDIYSLPADLFNSLSDTQRTWLRNNEVSVLTDGEHVFMPDAYVVWYNERSEAWLQRIVAFSKWIEDLIYPDHSDDEILAMYESPIVLKYKDREVELPFDADTYSTISSFLKDIIKEW